MIEIAFTVKQARRLMRAIHTDAELNSIYEMLRMTIEQHDQHIASKAPWRKVVRHYAANGHHYDELECGHRYMLRRSHRPSCDWIEDHANKRRCEKCAT